MGVQQIGQGPGNLKCDKVIRKFKANGTITAGEVVMLYGTTGYTVDQCGATNVPIGVALDTVTDGNWLNVQQYGICDVALTNDGTDIVADDILYAAAAGGVLGITAGDDQGVTVGRAIGIATQADTGTTCSNVFILIGI